MKISLNWVKLIDDEYGCSANPLPKGIDDLVERIGAQLGAVEEVINLGERYQGIVVTKVVSCVKHPNADKLSICMVDDGGTVKKVARDKSGLVQVVCGAPNVKAGQLVAWIPPGVTVPSTFDKEPFVLEAREIRGKVSNGMIASAKELALGDNHEGILVIDEPAKPGQTFAGVYGLDDYIIDIENKMFTHRPDLFGMLGIAREIAGIQNQVFKSPSWYKENSRLDIDGRAGKLKLTVKNEAPKLVPRFCVIAIKDIKVGPSPVWLQTYLARIGIRPINNIVDLTNYIMYETSQPLHAYDYDKLKTGILGIRLSKKGEELTLLGGKAIKLDRGAVVITDGQKPIGLGGVMGGAETEVDESTKNIVIECANFDMNLTRKTAMTYGLFTDAATRFTKGQSPRQNLAVLARIVENVLKPKYSGGRVASPVVDDKNFKVAETVVKTDTEFINQRLGLKLSGAQIKKLLENVQFKVEISGGGLKITAPFWRTDIEIAEDIVEEAGRLYGYDKLPQELPLRTIEPAAKNQLIELKDSVRQILAEFGANEILTYSFVHSDLLKKANQDVRLAYKLNNALSPNLQYYRFNLLPSLLDKVHANIKAGYDKFALFEIGKGHDQDHKDKDGLPQEFELLSFIYTESSKTKPVGAAFYQAKSFLVQLADKLGIKLKFNPVDELPKAPLAQAYEKQRTAMVSTKDGKFLGIIGELKAKVRQDFKLPEHTAGFEIDIEAFLDAVPATKAYQPLPRFPETYQDLCLRTSSGLSYEHLSEFIDKNMQDASKKHGYNYSVEAVDIYQADKDKDHKQTTWRITLWHPERTLTTDETNKLLDEIASRAKKELSAERI